MSTQRNENMPNHLRGRPKVCVTISREAKDIMNELASRFGVSQGAVIEALLRDHWAERSASKWLRVQGMID